MKNCFEYVHPLWLLHSNLVISFLLVDKKALRYVHWRVWFTFHSLMARFAFLWLSSFFVLQFYVKINLFLNLVDNLLSRHFWFNRYFFLFKLTIWHNKIYSWLIFLENLSLGKLHYITIFATLELRDFAWFDTIFWIILLLFKIIVLLLP